MPIGGVKKWRTDHGLLPRNVTRKKPDSRSKRIRKPGGSKRKRARPVQDRRSAIRIWILPAYDLALSLFQSSGIISATIDSPRDEKGHPWLPISRCFTSSACRDSGHPTQVSHHFARCAIYASATPPRSRLHPAAGLPCRGTLWAWAEACPGTMMQNSDTPSPSVLTTIDTRRPRPYTGAAHLLSTQDMPRRYDRHGPSV